MSLDEAEHYIQTRRWEVLVRDPVSDEWSCAYRERIESTRGDRQCARARWHGRDVTHGRLL